MKSHEVQLLVSPPIISSGNSLQKKKNILRFEALSDKIHAWLEHRVSAGMMCETRPDEDDGCGQLVPFCRECTLSRPNPQSRVSAAIPGGNVIGPAIEVRIVKILDQYGLEIASPSPHNHEKTSHVMITRGTNRFVDEVDDHKVELRPSTELLSALQKSEGREYCVEESNNRNKETCAPHVASRKSNKEACANNFSSSSSRSSFFQNSILTNDKKWVVIPANPSYGGAL